MAESTLSVTRTELRRYVCRYLYWDLSSLSAEQETDLDDILRSALRDFYRPPVLPGETSTHRWSFMRPIWRFTLTQDVGDYDLPDDFGGFCSDLFYRDYHVNAPLRETGRGMIDALRQQSTSAVPFTGQPLQFATFPLNNGGATPQRLGISFYPTPDQEYELIGQYEINPNALAADVPYPMGGQPHSETLIAACLAAAELQQNDIMGGPRYAKFIERLRTSIAYDRKVAGGPVGKFMSDGPSREVPFDRTQYMLYNGQRYDD